MSFLQFCITLCSVIYNTPLVTALNLPYVIIHILAYIYLYIEETTHGKTNAYFYMIYEQRVLFVPPGLTTASARATTGPSFCVSSLS